VGLDPAVRGVIAFLRTRYGASPGHLLGHLACFAVAGYALWAVLPGGGTARAVNLALWLVAGAVLHDLVGLPLYTLADRAAQRLTFGHHRLLNHLRVPAAISLVLLLVFIPLILDLAPGNYRRATGHDPTGYLAAWLAITAGLLVASALLFAVRSRGDQLQHAGGAAGDEDPPGGGVDGDAVGLADGRQAP
jgi:Na+/melibiose symporter-like transporter